MHLARLANLSVDSDSARNTRHLVLSRLLGPTCNARDTQLPSAAACAPGHSASGQPIQAAPAKASTAGDTMAMNVVLQLPPRLSSRMRVSLESLGKGGRGSVRLACAVHSSRWGCV